MHEYLSENFKDFFLKEFFLSCLSLVAFMEWGEGCARQGRSNLAGGGLPFSHQLPGVRRDPYAQTSPLGEAQYPSFPPMALQPSKLPFAPSFSLPWLSYPPGQLTSALSVASLLWHSTAAQVEPSMPCADPRALAAPLLKPYLGCLGCLLPVLMLPGYGRNDNDIFSWCILPRPFWS